MSNGVNETTVGMVPLPGLARLLDLVRDMACVVGKNGRFQWVNAAFARGLGWKPADLQHMALIELIHPQDKDRFLTNVADLFRQKPVADLSCRLRTADESYRWFEWRIEGFAGGGMQAILQDVMEPSKEVQMQVVGLTAAVGRATALPALLQACAAALVGDLETAVVRIWTVEEPGGLLRLAATAGQPASLDRGHSDLAVGQAEVARIARERRPCFSNDLSAGSGVEGEPVAFAGHPLLVEDELMGVVGLFGWGSLPDWMTQAVAEAAPSIAVSIWRDRGERAQRLARDELALEVARLTAEVSEKNILLRAQVTERDETNIILRKRAAELEIVTRVSAAASAIAGTERLMQEVVNLIKVSFDLYHAHFYVLNDVGDALALSIGAGEVGRKLLEQGHTIPLSQPNSLVVRAALTRQGVIENDLYAAPGYLANPLLPESRSSMAIPMIVGDEVLGVLNVQSDVVNHFTDEDVRIQTTLAAQIALALQHTRSLARAQAAIEELNGVTRRLSREGWADYLAGQSQPHLGYGYDLVQTRPMANGLLVDGASRQVVKQSLAIQGNQIGELLLTDPQAFAEEADEMLNEVAEQLTAHIETLRLSEQTQVALARTEALYASSDRIVRAGSSEAVLAALVDSVGLDQFASASLLFFDRPWERSQPEYMRTAAVWTNPVTGMVPALPGTVFPFSQFPSLRRLRREAPVLFADVTDAEQTGGDLQGLLEQWGTRGVAFFPLTAGQEWFGVFAGLTLDVLDLHEEEVRRLRSLTDQAAAVIQNLRLYEQTQAALAQTEALYQISTYLNAATHLDDIARAVAVPSVSTGAVWAGVWLLERDEEKRPLSLELAGSWNARGALSAPSDITMSVSEMDFPELLSDVVNSPPVFLSNLRRDNVRLLPEAHMLVQKQGFQSGIILPLRYGENVLGLATIAWDAAHQFDEGDKSLHRLLMAQVGVAVHSQLLLRDSRRRSEQLEKLARIENDLSLANNEEEIILAVANNLGSTGMGTIALGHIDAEEGSGELIFQLVSLWHEGAFMPDVAGLLPVQPLSSYPATQLWLHRSDEIVAVADVLDDERVTEEIRQQAARDSWRAMALLPLRSGGRWQGVMVFNWAEPHPLTADEKFLLQQLLEPVAATVATRRAFVAQLAARQEMGELYEASRRLNEADDLQELLESVVAAVAIADISRANLWVFQPSKVAEEAGAELLAAWSGDPNRPALPVGTVFPSGEDGFVAFIKQTDSRFVENVADDVAMPERMRLLNVERGVASLVILPLLVQGERRGVIVLSAQRPHGYSEREQRICLSLTPQIAIVLENKRLLEAAQARAERERLLREVTEKVRRSLHVETVMKTAVEEVGRILGRRAVIYLDDTYRD